MKEVRIRRDAIPDHPWIYRKQVRAAAPGTRRGDPVRILLNDGTPVGAGLFNGKSQIALRVLSRHPKVDINRKFLEARVGEAVRLRRYVFRLDERTDAYRVVNSEGDGLSGLVVDRYGSVLSIQVKCLGMFRLMPDIIEILLTHFPDSRIIYRRDQQAERIEGFRVPDAPDSLIVETRSDGLTLRHDLARGHKTGAFLDQRENRVLAATVSQGRQVLDLFCYEGAFALACARAGAKQVRGVDLDEEAVERAVVNARVNKTNVSFEHGDAFEILRGAPKTDFLLLDPPRWISGREDEKEGWRRYFDLNRLGLECLPRGGLLLTSSCSGRLSATSFQELLRRAADEAMCSLKILDVRGAAPDHPVPVNFPEGHYLTSVLAAIG